MLNVLAERRPETRRLAAIRAALAAFDGEFDDKQFVLECIGRITAGDEP
ncbi:MAG TPA: hypothetical protein VIX86_21880 [Streptosporangiaceae bacterium]